jgi:hypothetical protein
MTAKHLLLAGLAVAGLAGAAAPSFAGEAKYGPPLASSDCFRSRDWKGWSVADDKTIYLGVGSSVYRLDVLGNGRRIDMPGQFLVSRVRGVDRICSARDFDLKVADRATGVVTPLFPIAISKLTTAEAQALPENLRPTTRVR